MTYTDYGINGCAIAQNITYTLQFILIIVYLNYSSDETIQKCSVMPSMKTFETFKEFLHMAKYTLFLESLNIWIYEIISLMSGFLTVKDQAALAVDWNIKMLFIYLPYSFNLSITTLVSSSLSEGNIALA